MDCINNGQNERTNWINENISHFNSMCVMTWLVGWLVGWFVGWLVGAVNFRWLSFAEKMIQINIKMIQKMILCVRNGNGEGDRPRNSIATNECIICLVFLALAHYGLCMHAYVRPLLYLYLHKNQFHSVPHTLHTCSPHTNHNKHRIKFVLNVDAIGIDVKSRHATFSSVSILSK